MAGAVAERVAAAREVAAPATACTVAGAKGAVDKGRVAMAAWRGVGVALRGGNRAPVEGRGAAAEEERGAAAARDREASEEGRVAAVRRGGAGEVAMAVEGGRGVVGGWQAGGVMGRAQHATHTQSGPAGRETQSTPPLPR